MNKITFSSPAPLGDGLDCTGTGHQQTACYSECLQRDPTSAVGSISGIVNGIEIKDAQMIFQYDTREGASHFTGTISGVHSDIGPFFKLLTSAISPVYWIGAFEEDGASNGYRLGRSPYLIQLYIYFYSKKKKLFQKFYSKNVTKSLNIFFYSSILTTLLF